MPVLEYSSSWNKSRPLVYSDDCKDFAANKFIDRVFKERRTKRLTFNNGKLYYIPSEEYKNFITRIKQIK